MIAKEKLNTLKDGIEILHDSGAIQIYAESFDPSEKGQWGSLGSLFLKSDGKIYKKVGLDDLEWKPIDADTRKDIAILSMELAALKHQNLNNNLSFFLDSFNDDEDISIQSQNYVLNKENGYVGCNIENPQIFIEQTEQEFSDGTFANITLSENSLIKEKIIDGQIITLEDFENIDNVYSEDIVSLYKKNWEDGDDSDIYYERLSGDGDTGITTLNIVGNYGIRIDGNDRAYLNFSGLNLQSYSGVKLMFFCAGVSLDNSNEKMMVGWFDGSTWFTIYAVSNSETGYVEVDIPDSYLSNSNQICFDITNNSTLFGGTNRGNDSGYFDDVELSYTQRNNIDQLDDSYLVYQGSKSGKYFIDFSKNNEISIDVEHDISLYKFLKLKLYKDGNGVYNYKISIIDTNNSIWETTDLNFPTNKEWFEWKQNISEISGIDLTQIKRIKISFIENTETVDLVSYWSTSTLGWLPIRDDEQGKEDFKVENTVTIGRIKIEVGNLSNTPRVPLYIGIGNIFGTTYATGIVTGNSIENNNSSEIIVEFDSPVTLYAGNFYSIQYRTTETSQNYQWNIRRSRFSFGSDLVFYLNGNDNTNRPRFKLYAPITKEYIYLDQLQIEAESTYQTNGNYLSNIIDLGVTPDNYDSLEINKSNEGSDNISVAVKIGNTVEELNSFVWYTGLIQSLAPKKLIQYRLSWINGTSSDSTHVNSVKLQYNVSSGAETIIISKPVGAEDIPEEFCLLVEDEENSGSIDYFISRDSGIHYQYIGRNLNSFKNFSTNSGFGNNIVLKAVMTGEAKLLAWTLILDKDII